MHPNDHVNASQSSNDVFPTSVHVAVTQALIDDLIPALDHLAVALEAKAELWKDVVKSGRTHLMDATPVTLGQEFGGYARQMRLGIERVQAALPRVAEVPLGGTAVGTGINTPLGFPQKVIELLVADTELPITEAKDHFEAQANRDGLVEASGALRTIAVSLTKINNDLRWMGSGPNTGLGELHIPDLQPGSSIMPGKVNPVVPEAVAHGRARASSATTRPSPGPGASGSLRAQRRDPGHGHRAARVDPPARQRDRACSPTRPSTASRRTSSARPRSPGMSPSIVTPLNKLIGYEAAAKIAKHSVAKGITVREAVIDLGYVERGELTARAARREARPAVDDAPPQADSTRHSTTFRRRPVVASRGDAFASRPFDGASASECSRTASREDAEITLSAARAPAHLARSRTIHATTTVIPAASAGRHPRRRILDHAGTRGGRTPSQLGREEVRVGSRLAPCGRACRRSRRATAAPAERTAGPRDVPRSR